jgi:hypothetical protein
MDATPYGTDTAHQYRLRRAVARLTPAVGRGRFSVFGFTDNRDNVRSIFVVSVGCGEDETATEGLLSINEWNNQRNE